MPEAHCWKDREFAYVGWLDPARCCEVRLELGSTNEEPRP